MSAGQPDWNKLAAMGKLPQESRNKIPYLAQLDAAAARIKQLEEENARLRAGGGVELAPMVGNEETTQLKCEECGIMIGGKTEQVAKMQMGKHKKAKHAPEPQV